MSGNRLWLCADQIFDGRHLQTDHAIGLADGKVVDVLPVGSLPIDAICHRKAGTLTPGYVDLQVNGGGDVLLNNAPTPEAMRVISAALRRFGTMAVLPTVITDAPEVLARAVDAAIEVKGEAGLLGLHIEGPHISLSRRGTHAATHIRPLDFATVKHLERLIGHGIFVMITLAPEAVQPGQIATLVDMGVTVSIGHSDATDDRVSAALTEGATCFTHLFNAMSPMTGRAPGVTGTAINSRAHCGFICDGHHVSDAMLGLAIRARPQSDRMFLVSDCMSTVGGSDCFSLYGQEIRVNDGRLINAEGALAGAHVTMAEGVARLIRKVGVTPEQALRMATSVPAGLVRAENLGHLIGQRQQDLLVLGSDWMPTQVGI